SEMGSWHRPRCRFCVWPRRHEANRHEGSLAWPVLVRLGNVVRNIGGSCIDGSTNLAAHVAYSSAHNTDQQLTFSLLVVGVSDTPSRSAKGVQIPRQLNRMLIGQD